MIKPAQKTQLPKMYKKLHDVCHVIPLSDHQFVEVFLASKKTPFATIGYNASPNPADNLS